MIVTFEEKYLQELYETGKAGISSIRVNKQYRIEFEVTDNGVEPVVTVCN